MKKIYIFLFSLLIFSVAHAQDGILDTSFNNGGIGANEIVYALAVQTDGKIIIGGGFSTYNGIQVNYITRLNANGTIDSSFNSGTGANNAVYSIALQPDGKIIIGGIFTTYNGIATNRITRLNTNGTIDPTFHSGMSTMEYSYIRDIALQPDGKIIIGGFFSIYNGIAANGITRLNVNGTKDATFTSGLDPSYNMVDTIAVQPNGKIIIGGNFFTYDGTTAINIVRLNANGSKDITFNSGTGAGGTVTSIVLQPDGKIIVGGAFPTYNGIAANGITRLNANGSKDATFNSAIGANNSTVYDVALQPDGKIIIGGLFTSYNNFSAKRITRLNSNGTKDATFTSGAGANDSVECIALQSDGKIIIGGRFTSYNGAGPARVTRLTTGLLDTTSFDGKKGFTVFPNPADDSVMVNVGELTNASLQIFDVQGRELQKQNLSVSNTINIENLPTGVYLFKVTAQEGTTTQRVIKK